MTCNDVRSLVHASLDRELDLLHQMEIDDHLRQCKACEAVYESHRTVQAALKTDGLCFPAPADLQRRVRASIRSAGGPRRWWSPGLSSSWLGAAAAAAIVIIAVIAGPIVSRRSQAMQVEQEVVSAHIRSLMANHLTDVPSSDQHTVKPWFAGRLDFSPPVVDLNAEGFPLVGGRLDYVDNRPIAALAYRRGQHVINLFVWPSLSSADVREALDSRHGYNAISWTRDRANFWAVSDLNAVELREFAHLIQARVRG
jgi:anti-sigma factor RsiW